ncbi:MAG: carbamoyltransferase family protein [Hyphomicrobium sp.]
MRILGLVGATHDSGIAILDDGVIEVVIEEERLRREKRTRAFPSYALKAALGEDGCGFADIDALVTPWDAARLRRSFAKALIGNFPASLSLLAESTHTPQRNEIAILNHYLKRKLRRRFPNVDLPPLINVGHHESHAASFFVSPFERAAVLVMDGYGDDAATSVFSGAGNRVERHWRSTFFNSLGMVYTFVTGYLGFEQVADEGKVMALAALGDDSYVTRFQDCVKLLPEGGYAVNMDYFSFDAYGQWRPMKRRFFDVFGPPRAPGAALEDRHKAIAFALQHVTEQTVLNIVRQIIKDQKTDKLVFAGGVALNCVANARILELTSVKEIWVPPGASDCGAPLGACLWHYHQTLGHARSGELRSASYGLAYSDADIDAALRDAGLDAEILTEEELMRRAARDLARGAILGWFQGRFEMGPRALGNRSILADPRRASIRDELNAKIKKRESFRPFAPAILRERASEYFFIDPAQADPFMTLAPCIRPEKAREIPAAVHADGTGRIQTVERDVNPRFYALIDAFAAETGVPVLLNTSFNRQEPIVASPKEAVSCFLRTNMDALALGLRYVAPGRRSRQAAV